MCVCAEVLRSRQLYTHGGWRVSLTYNVRFDSIQKPENSNFVDTQCVTHIQTQAHSMNWIWVRQVCYEREKKKMFFFFSSPFRLMTFIDWILFKHKKVEIADDITN